MHDGVRVTVGNVCHDGVRVTGGNVCYDCVRVTMRVMMVLG